MISINNFSGIPRTSNKEEGLRKDSELPEGCVCVRRDEVVEMKKIYFWKK